MALSREEIIEIARASAQTVLEGLHRYAKEYKEPETVDRGLEDSKIEENTASDWYRKRAKHAAEHGRLKTAALYETIAGQELHHYDEFNADLQGWPSPPEPVVVGGRQGDITWEHIIEQTDTYVLWQGKDPSRGDVFAFVAPGFGGLPATGYTTPRAAWNAFRPGYEFAYHGVPRPRRADDPYMHNNPPATIEAEGRTWHAAFSSRTKGEAEEEAKSMRESGSAALYKNYKAKVFPWQYGFAAYESWEDDDSSPALKRKAADARESTDPFLKHDPPEIAQVGDQVGYLVDVTRTEAEADEEAKSLRERQVRVLPWKYGFAVYEFWKPEALAARVARLARTEGDPLSKFCCKFGDACAPAELLEEGKFPERIDWLRRHYSERHPGEWGKHA